MAWIRLISPALTKLTSITVVAVEDWTRAVIIKPVKMPLIRLEVMAARYLSIYLRQLFAGPHSSISSQKEKTQRPSRQENL
jgi:hypothetical protein